MRRVLAGSWERLNDEEQRGLARLSVFRGGFSFGAAKTAFCAFQSAPASPTKRL